MDRRKPRACYRCRIVKPVEAFPSAGLRGSKRRGVVARPSGVCWGCTEAEAYGLFEQAIEHRATWWENRKGRRTRVRRCSDCGAVKILSRGYWRINKSEYARQCKPCHRAKTTALRRQQVARSADVREKRRAATKRWQKRHPDRVQAIKAAARKRLEADPKRYAEHLEVRRMNYRLNRERKGLPVIPLEQKRPKATMVNEPDTPRLPVQPLLSYVEERISAQAKVEESIVGVKTAVCQELGITVRTLYRWERQGAEGVEYDTAERVMLAAGLRFEDIWPRDIYAASYVGLLAST